MDRLLPDICKESYHTLIGGTIQVTESTEIPEQRNTVIAAISESE